MLPAACLLSALSVVEAQGPKAMTDRLILWDDRLDSVGQAQHQDRLVAWLVADGFRQVRSEELAAWMARYAEADEAGGSVVVMPMGYSPAALAEEPGERLLWMRYLKAGGRIVSVGDLPLNYFQYPDARPLPPNMAERGYGALGLVGGWDRPYWGRHLEVTPTDATRGWGFETTDTSITGFPVESVSIAFGTYTVPETGRLGASSWLKCLREDRPLSGLVKLCQFFDGRNDAQLRDVWRAANYVGQPVTPPPMPPPWQPTPAPDVTLRLMASALAGRTEFARGEAVTVQVTAAEPLQGTAVRFRLLQGEQVLEVHDRALGPAVEGRMAQTLTLPTEAYAYGDYVVKVSVLADGRAVGEATQPIGLRYVPPEGFSWHAWVGTAPNPYRRDMTFADIREAGMEPHLTDLQVEGMDAVLRQNLGFSLRLLADRAGGKSYEFEQSPEYFRLDLERKPVPGAYEGGRPTLGIAHPDLVANARATMRDPLAPVAQHPAFRPYVLTNDDYSIYYGWDFSPAICERFKAATGLDAPTVKPDPAPGVIEDNDPWLRWCEFSLREITGGWNRAQTQGVTEARADARVGPIPGGMQIPLIHMWEAAQYPPLNFGANGFNLLCSYYYNTYWQPVLTNAFWMEVGRLANRDLPQWCMPDLFMTGGYVRNNLFHLLAGGVQGLAYFTYGERNASTWAEVKHLAPLVRRVGPVQARLKPAPRKSVGLLVSLTTLCFEPTHALDVVYGYENLMQAHFDVEVTCEEEVLSGEADRFDVILLYDVRWLRQSVCDALVARAARGDLVLLDSSVPIDIPGAQRVNLDIGMGEERPLGGASTPGIQTYGDPDRIARVQAAVSVFVPPAFACEAPTLVANRFTADGASHTWFVNAHTGEEYMYCRERMGAGHPGAGTPEKIAELKAWETREMAAGPYRAEVVLLELPGIPYDLAAGRPVPTRKTDAGTTLELSMERFGGALIAFYPEAIDRVTVAGPESLTALRTATFRVEVRGRGGPIAAPVPVEITLTDPTGKVSVLSGVRAAKAGVVEFAWTPATNDVRGVWTLRAAELASGKTAERKVRLP